MAVDVLVSARVSQGKKDAAKKVLASLGATTSDLINSAFDYVLENKELPARRPPEQPSLQEFRAFMEETTFPIQWGEGMSDGDYRHLIREGKRSAYESLA